MQMPLVEEIAAFSKSERTLPPLAWSDSSTLGPQGLGVRTEKTNRLLFSFQGKCFLEGVLLGFLSWERKFSSTAARLSFSHGSSLQEFQQQVSNFSLLLSCLGWDWGQWEAKKAGVWYLCERPAKNKLLPIKEHGSVQGQVGWGLEQPDLEGESLPWQGGGNRRSSRSFPT